MYNITFTDMEALKRATTSLMKFVGLLEDGNSMKIDDSLLGASTRTLMIAINKSLVLANRHHKKTFAILYNMECGTEQIDEGKMSEAESVALLLQEWPPVTEAKNLLLRGENNE